jgi:hypothetical protein
VAPRPSRVIAPRPAGEVALAVLPLDNFSGDPRQDYFADGMTEALIADLAQIDGLRVISRTSSTNLKRQGKSIPQVAEKPVPTTALAQWHAAADETDTMFAMLERSLSDQPGSLRSLKVDPLFDSVRNDPRFADITRRAGR